MPGSKREREVERQRRLRQEQRRQAAQRRARRRNQIIASVLAVGLVLSGIAFLAQAVGGDPKPAATSTPTPTPTTSAVAFPPVPTGADPRLKTKPVATLPKATPTKLGVADVIVGKGAEAKAGQQVTVNYVGVGFPDGKEFDSSWKRSETFPFQLGAGRVIQGWDQGLVGMKVGGRRQLTIPSALAYGAAGQPPSIKANQPLVFVVDLLAVQ